MHTPLLRRLALAGRKFELTWRYVFNLAPTLAYRFSDHTLPSEVALVLNSLNRDGIAITSAISLLGPDSCYDELCADVERVENELAARIAAARQNAKEYGSIG